MTGAVPAADPLTARVIEARIMSSSPSPVSIAIGAAVAGIAVLTLTGCAGIQHALQHEHEESFATYALAEKGWVGVDLPGWIPADATSLHNLATDNEQVSVIQVTSDSEPIGCSDADRHGAPALTAEWSTDEWPDRLLTCGDYEVMPVEGGWLGWFNAAEDGDIPG